MNLRSKHPVGVDRSAALRFTDTILQELDNGDFGRRPSLATTFAPSLDDDECIICSAPFARQWFGTLQPGGGGVLVAGGSGTLGLAVMAGTGAAALRRRRRAAREARPAWRPLDHGQLFVSSHGFHLITDAGVLAFGWHAVTEAEPTSPGVIGIGCEMSHGIYERFLVTTVYAELIFELWARVRCPGHPARRTPRPGPNPCARS